MDDLGIADRKIRATYLLIKKIRSIFSIRKEVIQPHLPVRLPCYDFVPLTYHSFDALPLSVG